MGHSTFDASDSFDTLKQTYALDDQMLVGRCPSEDHLTSGDVHFEAIPAGLRPKLPVQGVMDPRQDQRILKGTLGLRGCLKRRALRQANDVLNAFWNRDAGSVQHDRVKRRIFPVDPEEPLHCAVVSGIISEDFAARKGGILLT